MNFTRVFSLIIIMSLSRYIIIIALFYWGTTTIFNSGCLDRPLAFIASTCKIDLKPSIASFVQKEEHLFNSTVEMFFGSGIKGIIEKIVENKTSGPVKDTSPK